MKEERENNIKSSINASIVHPFSSLIKGVCLVDFFSQYSGFFHVTQCVFHSILIYSWFLLIVD